VKHNTESKKVYYLLNKDVNAENYKIIEGDTIDSKCPGDTKFKGFFRKISLSIPRAYDPKRYDSLTFANHKGSDLVWKVKLAEESIVCDINAWIAINNYHLDSYVTTRKLSDKEFGKLDPKKSEPVKIDRKMYDWFNESYYLYTENNQLKMIDWEE
jgi:hypothetical protein